MNEIYVRIQLADSTLHFIVEDDTSVSVRDVKKAVADYFEELIAEGKPLRFQGYGRIFIYPIGEVKEVVVSADGQDKNNRENARLKLSDLAPYLVG